MGPGEAEVQRRRDSSNVARAGAAGGAAAATRRATFVSPRGISYPGLRSAEGRARGAVPPWLFAWPRACLPRRSGPGRPRGRGYGAGASRLLRRPGRRGGSRRSARTWGMNIPHARKVQSLTLAGDPPMAGCRRLSERQVPPQIAAELRCEFDVSLGVSWHPVQRAIGIPPNTASTPRPAAPLRALTTPRRAPSSHAAARASTATCQA